MTSKTAQTVEPLHEDKTTYKVYTVQDKHGTATYLWSKKIDRDTENNNALIKCPPCFLNAVQQKHPEITSDRLFKQWVCSQMGIQYREEFMHFNNQPFRTEPATVKAETGAENV